MFLTVKTIIGHIFIEFVYSDEDPTILRAHHDCTNLRNPIGLKASSRSTYWSVLIYVYRISSAGAVAILWEFFAFQHFGQRDYCQPCHVVTIGLWLVWLVQPAEEPFCFRLLRKSRVPMPGVGLFNVRGQGGVVQSAVVEVLRIRFVYLFWVHVCLFIPQIRGPEAFNRAVL